MTNKEDKIFICPKCIKAILARPENHGILPSQLTIDGDRVRSNGRSYRVGKLVACRDGSNPNIILAYNNLGTCGHLLTAIEMVSLRTDFLSLSLDLEQSA